MRCQNGKALYVEPVPVVGENAKSSAQFSTTLMESIQLNWREFNGFRIIATLCKKEVAAIKELSGREIISHGSKTELAIQPYVALGKDLDFVSEERETAH